MPHEIFRVSTKVKSTSLLLTSTIFSRTTTTPARNVAFPPGPIGFFGGGRSGCVRRIRFDVFFSAFYLQGAITYSEPTSKSIGFSLFLENGEFFVRSLKFTREPWSATTEPSWRLLITGSLNVNIKFFYLLIAVLFLCEKLFGFLKVRRWYCLSKCYIISSAYCISVLRHNYFLMADTAYSTYEQHFVFNISNSIVIAVLFTVQWDFCYGWHQSNRYVCVGKIGKHWKIANFNKKLLYPTNEFILETIVLNKRCIGLTYYDVPAIAPGL